MISKVTDKWIDSTIRSATYYTFPGTAITVCLLNLQNNFSVVGDSGFLSPDTNLNSSKKIAYQNARNKIWLLENYLAQEAVYEETAK